MQSFGAYLRSLREEKGKTLEDIAENTKIAVPNLESLEKDRYDLLPPLVFVKGFIRSYCQEIGVKPEEIMGKFEQATVQTDTAFHAEEDRVVFNKSPSAVLSSPWFTVGLTTAGAISLCILLLTLFMRLIWRDSPGNEAVRAGTERTKFVEQIEQRGVSSPKLEEQAVVSGSSDKKKMLEIRAHDNAWVRIKPDSGPADDLIMHPGQKHLFYARDSFLVQTGNAGGIRIILDGHEYQSFGKPNQPFSTRLP